MGSNRLRLLRPSPPNKIQSVKRKFILLYCVLDEFEEISLVNTAGRISKFSLWIPAVFSTYVWVRQTFIIFLRPQRRFFIGLHTGNISNFRSLWLLHAIRKLFSSQGMTLAVKNVYTFRSEGQTWIFSVKVVFGPWKRPRETHPELSRSNRINYMIKKTKCSSSVFVGEEVGWKFYYRIKNIFVIS